MNNNKTLDYQICEAVYIICNRAIRQAITAISDQGPIPKIRFKAQDLIGNDPNLNELWKLFNSQKTTVHNVLMSYNTLLGDEGSALIIAYVDLRNIDVTIAMGK